MERSSRGILWGSLAAAGLLAVVAAWLVLDNRARARENAQLRAELARARQAPARAIEPAPPVPPQKAPEPPPPQAEPATKEPPPKPPALQAKAQDPTAGPQERLTALARLRSAQPDGRSPDVVRSRIDLLRISPDGEIRADVCRQLSRVVSEELKQQLLVTARTDSFAKAREEAAETLGPMKADPVVRQALESIAVTDPDPRVQEQARKSLAGRR